MAEEIIVFAGPSLWNPATGLPDPPPAGFQRRPPARRGDLIAALGDAPAAIVLLDGFFHNVLSVAHKEVLRTLEEGIPVIGAASMGALRAAELEEFGMVGAGRVFEWFRDGTLDGDDEVAVLHLPEESGCRPVTVALVELRWALDGIRRKGLAGDGEISNLISVVKSWSFDRRHPRRIREEAVRILQPRAAEALGDGLRSFSLKRSDCREALRLASTTSKPTVSKAREKPTIFLVHLLEENLRPPLSAPDAAPPPSHAKAFNAAQLLHPGAPAWAASVRTRFLLASAAVQAGLEPESGLIGDIQRRLAGKLRSVAGGLLLPQSEIREEAAMLASALQARRHFGSTEAALQWLAAAMGLDPEGGAGELDDWLQSQFNLQPAWIMARAFVFCTAYGAASKVAAAAEEIHSRFAEWAEGRRPSRPDVLEQAAALWDCAPEDVSVEAGRRGLLPSGGFSRGFQEIVEWILPAERSTEAINEYPALKRRLQAAELEDPFSFEDGRGSAALRQYELPVEFWRALLGDEMHFHMGHFPTPDTPLETAMSLAVDRLAQELPRSARLLDVGAGWGGPAFQLVKAGLADEALCLTDSRTQMRHIAAEAKRRGLPVRPLLTDVEEFDFEGLGRFDVLWLFEVLEHIADRSGLLKRLTRAAAPGALLAVATTCASPSAGRQLTTSPLAGVENLQSADELGRVLERSGWTVLHCEDVTSLLAPLWNHWRQRLGALLDSEWEGEAKRLRRAFSDTEGLFDLGQLQAVQMTAKLHLRQPPPR